MIIEARNEHISRIIKDLLRLMLEKYEAFMGCAVRLKRETVLNDQMVSTTFRKKIDAFITILRELTDFMYLLRIKRAM